MKKFKKNFLLCLILILGIASFVLNGAQYSLNEKVFAEEARDEQIVISTVEELLEFRDKVNSGDSKFVSGNVKLEKSLDLSEVENWVSIKTFKGTFDGNGKSIENLTIKEGSSRGLFENLEGAKIFDLGVGACVVLSEKQDESTGEYIPNEQIVVGGICARASLNSKISASYSKLSVKATRIKDFSKTAVVSEFYEKVPDSEEEETLKYETFAYSGELIIGGVVGKLSESSLENCYSIPEINILQNGNNNVSTYIGGVVGVAENGSIHNVYVAPSNSFTIALENKNGDLLGVDAKNSSIKINSEKDSNSEIVFGGIVGFGAGVKLTNALFSSVCASLSMLKIQRGGLVGKIVNNETAFPTIAYSRFLNLAVSSTSNVLAYPNGGIGNANEVGFEKYSGVSVDAMPTQNAFASSWEWDSFRPWFLEVEGEEEIWKKTSIISSSGLFFPALQKFASFTITVAGSKEVSYTSGGAYLSGYYTLSISGLDKKTNAFTAGQNVTLSAKLFDSDGNSLHNFKKYFKFVNWQVDGKLVANIKYGEEESTAQSGYSVELNEELGETKLSFVASSQTEGVYTVGIAGNPVVVNVKFRNNETNSHQENIGKISKKVGNNVEEYVDNFSFTIDSYQNGLAVSLVADASESGEYIFANKWVDENSISQTTAGKTIVVELNNEQKTSSARFYPTVVSTSEGLVANIVAYFSNNTSALTVGLTEGGKIQVDEEEIESKYQKNIINGTTVVLKATPNEGMKFVGWFNGENEISTETEFVITVSEATNIQAKFEKIEENKGGLAWWVITLLVVCPVFVGGIIAIIVVKVKKGGRNSYRKNFKY